MHCRGIFKTFIKVGSTEVAGKAGPIGPRPLNPPPHHALLRDTAFTYLCDVYYHALINPPQKLSESTFSGMEIGNNYCMFTRCCPKNTPQLTFNYKRTIAQH